MVPDETISWNRGPFHVFLRGGPNSEGQMFVPFQMAYLEKIVEIDVLFLKKLRHKDISIISVSAKLHLYYFPPN